MSLTQTAPKFMDMPMQAPKKEGIRVISLMPTHRIIGFILYRHRVGLLMLSTVTMLGYIAYDKFLYMFF